MGHPYLFFCGSRCHSQRWNKSWAGTRHLASISIWLQSHCVSPMVWPCRLWLSLEQLEALEVVQSCWLWLLVSQRKACSMHRCYAVQCLLLVASSSASHHCHNTWLETRQHLSQACNGIWGCVVHAQVLAMGRNTAALSRLVVLDPARVVPVVLRPDEALLTVLKVALKQHEVRRHLAVLCAILPLIM